MAKDPYTVLGVSRDAKDGDIQKAFRKHAKKYHPDLNPGDKKAEDRFKEINAAYDILGDSAKRQRFDRGEIDAGGAEVHPFARGGGPEGGFRHGGFQRGPGGGPGAGPGGGFAFEDISDLFGGMFGGGRGGQRGGFQGAPTQGEDQRFALDVDFLEAVRGGKKRLTLPGGKTLDVNIPAGISEGQTIRLKGQGAAGPAGAGDALIEIKVREHPFYKREDQNIRLELPITLQEAVLGAKIEIPTVHGPVTMTIPKGANTGTVLRLKGKGIPGGKSQAAGDQYVTLKVMLPPKIEDELEAFIRTWGAEHPYNPRADLEKAPQ